jgi:hypothetical protein
MEDLSEEAKGHPEIDGLKEVRKWTGTLMASTRQRSFDFRKKHDIQDVIQDIDGLGLFWQKLASPAQSPLRSTAGASSAI